MLKCPGLDKRRWQPEDVFNVPCPACQKSVEFFKTDSVRKCPRCHCSVRNPRLDLGCANWARTPEFRIVWDADWLVNLPEELTSEDRKHPADTVERIFRTESGKKKAYELLTK